MKYIRFKELIHLTCFGYDDENRGAASSISLTSPLSAGSTSDTKRLKFRFTPINDVILSNFARIVIECVNIPNTANVVAAAPVLTAPFTVRTTSITNYKSFDSQNNGTNPLLIFYSDKSNDFFQNTHPDMLFNYSVDKTFLQRGELELIIQYPNTTNLVVASCFDTFAITFIIYDIDEDLLFSENSSDYKKEHLRHPQTFLNNTENTFNTQSFNKKVGY
jgi:hypothetical protein